MPKLTKNTHWNYPVGTIVIYKESEGRLRAGHRFRTTRTTEHAVLTKGGWSCVRVLGVKGRVSTRDLTPISILNKNQRIELEWLDVEVLVRDIAALKNTALAGTKERDRLLAIGSSILKTKTSMLSLVFAHELLSNRADGTSYTAAFRYAIGMVVELKKSLAEATARKDREAMLHAQMLYRNGLSLCRDLFTRAIDEAAIIKNDADILHAELSDDARSVLAYLREYVGTGGAQQATPIIKACGLTKKAWHDAVKQLLEGKLITEKMLKNCKVYTPAM